MVPLGIPLSVFRSWPEEDQDHALAWMWLKGETCSGCGTRRWEWEGKPPEEPAFEPVSDTCQVCVQNARYADRALGKDRAGVRVYSVPREQFIQMIERGDVNG